MDAAEARFSGGIGAEENGGKRSETDKAQSWRLTQKKRRKKSVSAMRNRTLRYLATEAGRTGNRKDVGNGANGCRRAVQAA